MATAKTGKGKTVIPKLDIPKAGKQTSGAERAKRNGIALTVPKVK